LLRQGTQPSAGAQLRVNIGWKAAENAGLGRTHF